MCVYLYNIGQSDTACTTILDFPLIGNFLVDDLEFEDENESTSATANKPDDSRPPPIVDFEIEAVVLENPPDLSFTSTSAGII